MTTELNARIEKDIRINLEYAYFKKRSAWDKGVVAYASELFENVLETMPYSGNTFIDYHDNSKLFLADCLNGASSWSQFSWGGSSSCYNEDIAKRLCTKSELKKTDNGRKKPNAHEDWLDVQSRALWQAYRLLDDLLYTIVEKDAF